MFRVRLHKKTEVFFSHRTLADWNLPEKTKNAAKSPRSSQLQLCRVQALDSWRSQIPHGYGCGYHRTGDGFPSQRKPSSGNGTVKRNVEWNQKKWIIDKRTLPAEENASCGIPCLKSAPTETDHRNRLLAETNHRKFPGKEAFLRQESVDFGPHWPAALARTIFWT